MHQLLLQHAKSHGFAYEPRSGAGGDGGLDGWVQRGVPGLKGSVAFQFKWLWEDIHKGSKAAQIKDSLERVSRLRKKPRHWVLVTPWDLKPSEREWLSDLGASHKLTVHHWGQTELEHLLMRLPSLFARYYPHAAGLLPEDRLGLDFRQFALSYQAKVVQRHRHLRTLGLPPETLRERDARTEIPLRDLFVPLRFLSEDGQHRAAPLASLLAERKSVVVLGDPGAGKSTLLAFLSLLLAGEAELEGFTPAPRTVPILVSLRQFVRERSEQGGGLSILEYLVRHAQTDFSLEQAHSHFFDAALRMGEAVVLFDGLDEVGSAAARHRIAGMINSFRSEYPQCPVWVTSRIYGYTPDVRLPASELEHVRLGRLDDAQVGDFIHRWYTLQCPHNERERAEFTDSLHRAVQRTPSVRRLAGNPLLLTLMAFIHQGTKRLPKDRGELYSKCTEMLLKTWQEAKYGEDEQAPHAFSRLNLPIQTQKDYLAHLALHVQERNQQGEDEDSRGLISRPDALESLANRHLALGRRERPGLTPGEAREEMKNFLDYISDQTGLLLDRGGDQLSFIHLSFQEYLAAWVFTCQPELHDNPTFFIKHLGLSAWEEVLLLRLYIVRFEQGGTSGFDTIVGAVLRHLERGGPSQGWLMLARALRDNLDFSSGDQDTILKRAIGSWVDSPQERGTWFSALEEIKLFAEEEKARKRLKELLDEACKQENPARAVAALHLRTRLLEFPAEATAWLEGHRNREQMLPDLVAFMGAPGMDVFLAERATLTDWEVALSALDGRRLYLSSLEWALGVNSNKAGEKALRAATAVLNKKTLMELQSRRTFADVHRKSSAASLFVRPGRILSENLFYKVGFPLSAMLAGPAFPEPPAGTLDSLLNPALAAEQVESSTMSSSVLESAVQAWVERFIGAQMNRVTSVEISISGIARVFSRAFSSDFSSDFVRDFSSDFVRDFVRDFGSDFVRDFGRDFVRDFGSEFVRDFGREFVRDFGREFVRDFGSEFVRDFGSEFVRNFDGAFDSDFGRDFGRDFGLDPGRGDWEQQWTQFVSSEENLIRMLQDWRFWDYNFFFRTNRFDLELDPGGEELTAVFENPLAIPLLLVDALTIAANNHLFSLGRHAAVAAPGGGKYWKDVARQWSRKNPFDVYVVSLSWEEHARIYASQHGRLTGAAGALMLAHAAYARLMSGLALSGPVWARLVEERDRQDPHIHAGYLLHEICHFRDVEQNVLAWEELIKAVPAESRTSSPTPASPMNVAHEGTRSPPASTPARAAARRPETEPPPEPLFAWVHLSDIHIGHGGAGHVWDQKLVLSALHKDIVEEQKRGQLPRPEALLVTGDIAFSGEPSQYGEAKKWLLGVAKATGLDERRIFTVPGNHDVQRAADKESTIKRLMRGLREGADDLDEVLKNETDRGLLARRMESYLAFAAQLAPGCLPEATTSLASWMHRLVARGGLRVRLVGLNTAMLSADDQDKGKLKLGKEAVGHALNPLPDDDELVLVLSHHPLREGWLADQRAAESWMKSHAHVHLSGHVHEAELEELRAGSGNNLLRIIAGAAHGDHQPAGVPASHGYNMVAVYPRPAGGLLLRVWPRLWSDNNKDFRPDIHNLPKGRDYAEHAVESIRLPPVGQ
ncbi:metallophosphoesterase [Archangium lansingense]|uniref:Metallophosphoesterase n=1 Tax=Archangium lansingense TaxID=2995310 RepID=A0ABT3ZZ50_9BACT|nr:metallophosphoesterase [Archangium lansinium]MCY1074685.1 metallophosphoesterase [Archangium lansinium]